MSGLHVYLSQAHCFGQNQSFLAKYSHFWPKSVISGQIQSFLARIQPKSVISGQNTAKISHFWPKTVIFGLKLVISGQKQSFLAKKLVIPGPIESFLAQQWFSRPNSGFPRVLGGVSTRVLGGVSTRVHGGGFCQKVQFWLKSAFLSFSFAP